MAALLVWLCWDGRVCDDVGKVTDALLANMAILFVPVGAGAIVYADLFTSHWPAIVIAILLGTSVTVAVTAMAAQFWSRLPAATFRGSGLLRQWQTLARRLRVNGRRATRSAVLAIQRLGARLSGEWTFASQPRPSRSERWLKVCAQLAAAQHNAVHCSGIAKS